MDGTAGFLQNGKSGPPWSTGGILEAIIDCSKTNLREKKRLKEMINPAYRLYRMTL